MKTHSIFLFFLGLLLLSPKSMTAQTPDYKYGKISTDELNMKTYEPDTSAVAITLYKIGNTRFDYMTSDFGIRSTFTHRIKILKPEGKSYADVIIPFFVSNNSNGNQDKITNITATAYNLVNGKIEKSELSKKYIFEEKSSTSWRIMKFSIPNVKEGSVIEYRYTYQSGTPYFIKSWIIQEAIPVCHAQYQINIPEYFIFNMESKGYEEIAREQTNSTFSFSYSPNNTGSPSNINANCTITTLTSNNLPAFKEEPFMWCPEDFRTAIEFELSGTQYPGSGFQSYSTTWDKIRETLKEYDGFGKYLNLKNPYEQEMKQLNLNELSAEEQIRALFKFLKKHIKWNNEYRLTGEDIPQSIKQGSGSNANLNFIFMSMLRSANFTCNPLLLRLRENGTLPIRPTIDRLNTFIIAVYLPDDQIIYVDVSTENGDINLLSPTLMVKQAVPFDNSYQKDMVDLCKIGNHFTEQEINAVIHPDGSITGKRLSRHNGLNAILYKHALKTEKDSIDTMHKTEEKYNIKISSCTTSHSHEISTSCYETLEFTSEAILNDDYIYINPMLFPDETTNHFTHVSRKYPVEFPYAQITSLKTHLQLPEGYVVESLPKSIKMVMNGREMVLLYSVIQKGNMLHTTYNSAITKLMFLPTEYSEIRTFWEAMISKNNEQIVLKKATPEP